MTPRVLITRAPDKAESLIHQLAEYGITGFAVPATETILAVKNKKIPGLSRFNWLAFTSGNGVLAFTEALKMEGITLKSDIKIAAVGNHTARLASEKLKSADLVPAAANSEALADTIIETSGDIKGVSVLWPCAENALGNFGEKLKAAGAFIEPWPCYRTLAVEPMKLRQNLRANLPWELALFAAPSAVRAFKAAWDGDIDFICLAIGSTTADALKKLAFDNIVISRGTGEMEVTESIINSLKGRTKN